MKKMRKSIKLIVIAATGFLSTFCTQNLLEQDPTTQMPKTAFWKTPDDATKAIYGVYSSIRPYFSFEYSFDCMTEIAWSRGSSANTNTLYSNGSHAPTQSNFSPHWIGLYGGVNRANYVIDNVNAMLPTAGATDVPDLERVLGEARFLRALCYFRLISLWGDMIYLEKTVEDKDEVITMSRMPIKEIYERNLADFTYAYEKLPKTIPASQTGRASKVAALAFRGKMHLFWACWNKFGWPELAGFTPDAGAAATAYAAAEADFEEVIDDYGLKLFRDGAPGSPGSAGSADPLPNYYHMFTPNYDAPATNSEIIFAFAWGGPLLGQGSNLLNDLGNRSTQNSQSYVGTTIELAKRYQLVSTGDFSPITVNKATPTAEGNALNPATYEGRDYRCRSTILWDKEKMTSLVALQTSVPVTWLFKTTGAGYIEASAMTTGYVVRKWIRNEGMNCERNDTPQDFYLMRLADVYLMYAEAVNAQRGPQAKSIELVNKIRARAGLPALASTKTDNAENFFLAIEQERIVEFPLEGQRYFDLRRWRRFESVWGEIGGNGLLIVNTYGENVRNDYSRYVELSRQRYYILPILQAERNRNPNLTQNTPWL